MRSAEFHVPGSGLKRGPGGISARKLDLVSTVLNLELGTWDLELVLGAISRTVSREWTGALIPS